MWWLEEMGGSFCSPRLAIRLKSLLMLAVRFSARGTFRSAYLLWQIHLNLARKCQTVEAILRGMKVGSVVLVIGAPFVDIDGLTILSLPYIKAEHFMYKIV